MSYDVEWNRKDEQKMCTRYYMELSPELRPYVEAAYRSPLREKMITRFGRQMITEGEVRPGDIVPVIATSQKGNPAVYPMVFGFPTKTGNLVLNARTETAAQKPMFREAWSRRRCIIPASWYYEWEHLVHGDGKKKTGDKYMFQSENSQITWLCGLYRIDEGFPCFVILTKDAPDEVRKIHDRMPLIIPSGAVSRWIDPASDPKEFPQLAVNHLFYEKV